MSHMPNKITAPIARSTAYDFNCKLARCHQTSRHAAGHLFADTVTDEDRHVMPHEILFQINDKKPSTRMQAMSSLNGVPYTTDLAAKLNNIFNKFGSITNPFTASGISEPNAEKLLKEYNRYKNGGDPAQPRLLQQANLELNDLFRYVGVAITGCQAGAVGALQRQGFSATRGGLMTIINTGKETMYPGSQIRMHFDLADILQINASGRRETSIDGIPRNKLIPRIVAENEDIPESIDDAGPLIYRLQWEGSFGPDPILLHRDTFAYS